MTWPTDDLSKTDYDADTDSPLAARAQLEALKDKFSALMAVINEGGFTDRFGVGTTPSAWAASNETSIDIGSYGAIATYTSGHFTFEQNIYFDGTNRIYKNDGAASVQQFNPDGSMQYYTAPAGVAGNPVSLTTVFIIANDGTVTSGKVAPSGYTRVTPNLCKRYPLPDQIGPYGGATYDALLVNGNTTIDVSALTGATWVRLKVRYIATTSQCFILAYDDAAHSNIVGSDATKAESTSLPGTFYIWVKVSSGNLYINTNDGGGSMTYVIDEFQD